VPAKFQAFGGLFKSHPAQPAVARSGGDVHLPMHPEIASRAGKLPEVRHGA